uniref:LOC100132686 protein n=1 Tax=Homo sapiens TaxID=9606 RepID=Q8NEQ1_HUMAN|nr:LOC100132686 protein [Homo sapiens]
MILQIAVLLKKGNVLNMVFFYACHFSICCLKKAIEKM